MMSLLARLLVAVAALSACCPHQAHAARQLQQASSVVISGYPSCGGTRTAVTLPLGDSLIYSLNSNWAESAPVKSLDIPPGLDLRVELYELTSWTGQTYPNITKSLECGPLPFQRVPRAFVYPGSFYAPYNAGPSTIPAARDDDSFTFQLSSAMTGFKGCADMASGTMRQQDCNVNAYQRMVLAPVGGNWYRIKNLGSGRCLKLRDSLTADNTGVEAVECNTLDVTQLWGFLPNGDGTYTIRPKFTVPTAKCLDNNWKTGNGNEVTVWGCSTTNIGNSQRWKITRSFTDPQIYDGAGNTWKLGMGYINIEQTFRKVIGLYVPPNSGLRVELYERLDLTGKVFIATESMDTTPPSTNLTYAVTSNVYYIASSWLAHGYDAADYALAARLGGWGAAGAEKTVCQSHPGFVFTQGQNTDYNGCLGWCCAPYAAPTAPLSWVTHAWNVVDYSVVARFGGWSDVSYKAVCESYPGFVFTKGNNANYTGCNDWCCAPSAGANATLRWVTHFWDTADTSLANRLGGWTNNEKTVCESRPGFAYTKGNNADFPGCGGWCCAPLAAELAAISWVTHVWDFNDTALATSLGGWNDTTYKIVCEKHPGFFFTKGVNADYPGCGDYCCAPWNGADAPLRLP